MTQISLHFTSKKVRATVHLPLSKSLCNRALILQAQFPQIKIASLSKTDDTDVLVNALQSSAPIINLGAAGTAMRFATAFFAAQPGREVVLTGSPRMLQRPIADLVNALRQLGAHINYVGEDGFPPLKIIGQKLLGGSVEVNATASSQFASALLLVGPSMQNGLKLRFSGEVVSQSYLKMTVALLRELGVEVAETETEISVENAKNIAPKTYVVEADWSAAAFWYGFVALADDAEITLPGLQKNSTQGDAKLVEIFEALGVKTTFLAEGVLLQKRAAQKPAKLVINLNNTPDIAQPLAVTCAALGIGADFRGLQTLKIKETDRLLALQTELQKVGINAQITANSLAFDAAEIHPPTAPFKTYDDHRMAMSFALLASKFPITILNPEVVSKSYPHLWEDVAWLKG